MKPYSPSCKLAVRDSLDDEYSDDVEDDVFIRDGKSAKLSEENGLKRPLMAPRRQKPRPNQMASLMQRRARFWQCCEPFCYGFVGLVVLIGIIVLASVLLTMYPAPMQKLQRWMNKPPASRSINGGGQQMNGRNASSAGRGLFFGEEIPCTQLTVQTVWSRAFARLNSESPVRKADCNGDGIEDIIVGYGLDDSFQYDDVNVPKCAAAVGGFCEGGLLALDGRTGDVLWQSWTAFNVFSLFCSMDVNGDGQPDCVAAGRGGLVVAIDTKNGNVIWRLADTDASATNEVAMVIIDLYTVNCVRDLDEDGVLDIVAVHVEERETSRTGHIKLISGKTGNVIRTIGTPFGEEVFVPIQMVIETEGTEFLLITTGGQSSPGGLYMLKLSTIMRYTKESDLVIIYRCPTSGFMVPPVLTDLNGDGHMDIVAAAFNSTVFAFDGLNKSILWQHSFLASETVSSIVPGHFNNDNVTDFMVKYNSGPGFPIYYYSQTTVLNGVDGASLLERMILDAGGPYSLLGGMSLSQTLGGDFFLHWQTQCKGRMEPGEAYQFVPDSDIVQQSRADTCKLRYNTTTLLQLSAISRHINPAGVVLFTTDDMMLQLNQSDSEASNAQTPVKHPKMTKKLLSKETIQRNAVVPTGPQQTFSDSIPALRGEPVLPYREPQVVDSVVDRDAEPVRPSRVQLQRRPDQQSIAFDQFQQFQKQQQQQQMQQQQQQQMQQQLPLPQMNRYPSDRRRPIKMYDVDQDIPDDYETYLNLDTSNKDLLAAPRSRFAVNRDVRSQESEVDVDDVTSNETSSDANASQAVPKRAVHKETLWDIELDKELSESEASRAGADFDFSTKTKRTSIPTDVHDFLPTIASSGVLVKSAGNATSSLDFVFAMNVRESETFPPLLTPIDVTCVEEKMAAFRNFKATANQKVLEQKFLKDCLRSRLASAPPARSVRFESQIVVSRITIRCTCSGTTLNDGEICAQLNDVEHQHWTGFMGDDRDGLYT